MRFPNQCSAALFCEGPHEEETWSGAHPPPHGGKWYDGCGFWLNEVLGEELDEDDPRLTPTERQGFERSAAGNSIDVDRYGVFELPVTDERSEVPLVNGGALGLSALNHDPADLRSALLTSYDFVDDAGWLQEELRLRREVPLTLCTHTWPTEAEGQGHVAMELKARFDDVVMHFPLTSSKGSCQSFGRSSALRRLLSAAARSLSRWGRSLVTAFSGQAAGCQATGRHDGNDWTCTVHAKLLLLEFGDRLRVAVTTANLTRTHWCFRGEAVWVQDFPRLPVKAVGWTDASRLLSRGHFACTLAHFVADLLMGAPCSRQQDWAATLAAFDFSGASARLVPSLPGLFPQARARPAGGGLVLRLWAVCTAATAQGTPQGLLHELPGGAWRLCAEDPRGAARAAAIGNLSAESLAALRAARELGLQLRPEVELFADKENGQGDPRYEEDTRQTVTWLVRAVVEGTCSGRWAAEMPALLACLEVNYGLFALGQHLANEVWLQSEESHYVAITSSMSWLHESWLEDFDRSVRRFALHQPAGPALITPGGDSPLHPMYFELARRGTLCAHLPPWHAPGRERIPNHSKIIVRQLWDTGSGTPYGWVYVGSHNLSEWAWGRMTGDQCHGKLWVGNRELGVLLMQPRNASSGGSSAYSGLFAGTPLPFGVPLVPASIDGREERTREDQGWAAEDEAAVESWWGASWWWSGSWWYSSWWHSSWWNGSWWTNNCRDDSWQQSDSSDSEDDAPSQKDWRLQPSSAWWWT